MITYQLLEKQLKMKNLKKKSICYCNIMEFKWAVVLNIWLTTKNLHSTCVVIMDQK